MEADAEAKGEELEVVDGSAMEAAGGMSASTGSATSSDIVPAFRLPNVEGGGPGGLPGVQPDMRARYLGAMHDERVSFSECCLGDVGCVSLVRILERNTKVREVDLRGNGIREAGLVALASFLRHNDTVEQLCLEWNSAGLFERGMDALVAALEHNASVRELDLRNNKIGPQGGSALARMLTANATLVTLDLRWNAIGQAGGQALANALVSNTSLTKLHLSGNGVQEATLRSIDQCLKRNLDGDNIAVAVGSGDVRRAIQEEVDKVTAAAHEKRQKMAAAMSARQQELQAELDATRQQVLRVQQQHDAQAARVEELEQEAKKVAMHHEQDVQQAAADAQMQDAVIEGLQGRVDAMAAEIEELRQAKLASEATRRDLMSQLSHLRGAKEKAVQQVELEKIELEAARNDALARAANAEDEARGLRALLEKAAQKAEQDRVARTKAREDATDKLLQAHLAAKADLDAAESAANKRVADAEARAEEHATARLNAERQLAAAQRAAQLAQADAKRDKAAALASAQERHDAELERERLAAKDKVDGLMQRVAILQDRVDMAAQEKEALETGKAQQAQEFAQWRQETAEAAQRLNGRLAEAQKQVATQEAEVRRAQRACEAAVSAQKTAEAMAQAQKKLVEDIEARHDDELARALEEHQQQSQRREAVIEELELSIRQRSSELARVRSSRAHLLQHLESAVAQSVRHVFQDASKLQSPRQARTTRPSLREPSFSGTPPPTLSTTVKRLPVSSPAPGSVGRTASAGSGAGTASARQRHASPVGRQQRGVLAATVRRSPASDRTLASAPSVPDSSVARGSGTEGESKAVVLSPTLEAVDAFPRTSSGLTIGSDASNARRVSTTASLTRNLAPTATHQQQQLQPGKSPTLPTLRAIPSAASAPAVTGSRSPKTSQSSNRDVGRGDAAAGSFVNDERGDAAAGSFVNDERGDAAAGSFVDDERGDAAASSFVDDERAARSFMDGERAAVATAASSFADDLRAMGGDEDEDDDEDGLSAGIMDSVDEFLEEEDEEDSEDGSGAW